MVNLGSILAGARAARGFMLGLIFGLIGLGMLAGALVARATTAQEIRTFLPATGEVIGLVPSRSSRGGTTYAAEVRFRAEDGRTYTFREGVSSSPPSHRVGDIVNVRYESGNPANARLDDFLNTWFLPLLLGGLGVIFALVGAFSLLGALRAGLVAARAAITGF